MESPARSQVVDRPPHRSAEFGSAVDRRDRPGPPVIGDGPPPPPPPARPHAPRSRRRRIVRRVLWAVGAVILVAGGVAYWALDEYVIDHVEISDVAAYEAEQHAAAGAAVPAADAADETAGTASSGDAAIAADASSDAVVTDSTYTSDTLSITIEQVVAGSGDDTVTYYVADVVVADGTQLRGGFADNEFGENIVADTSDIAEYYDAIFAVNGDYYGFRDTGIVIRNGVLYRDEGARQGLAVTADGEMFVYDETTTTGDELLAAGVWNTISFGPALLADGRIADGIEDVEVDTNFGNHSIQGSQPRTGIGMIDADHFVFVVVDGRSTGYSRGVTMTEFAQIFQDLGATVAYNLDGGGSSTMYFDGELVNDPLGTGDERGTSDIFYLAA